MSRQRATSLTISNSRRGLIPGGSEHFKRYKILRRQQNRADSLSRQRTNRATNDEDSSNSDHSLDLDPDAEMQKVVNLCRTYASELYLPLKEKHSTNLVYSPLGYCVSTVLLLKGCIGPCRQELSQAIFHSSEKSDNIKDTDTNCSEVTTGLTALLDSIRETEDSYNFKHAYKLYIDSQHKLRLSYLKLVKAIHPGRIELQAVNFQETWEECSKRINQWAHSSGGKMLGEMVTRRSANPKMIFVNPIYFLGNWVHPFNPALTKDAKFFLNEKDFVNVPMMKSGILKNLLYAPINKLACRALALPYNGDHLCLVIFLPNEKAGLPLIETALESISPSDYFQCMQNFRKKLSKHAGFQVYIPCFKIDCTIDFQGPLKEIGVESIFQEGKADFSGLSRIAPKELTVTQILQKVVIEVNELGSAKLPKRFKDSNNMISNGVPQRQLKSSVESYGAGGDDMNASDDIIEFCVDHPFYFQVVDMKSDLIVLAGSCKNPLHGKDLGIKEFLQKYDIEVVPKKVTVPEETLSHGEHWKNN